MGRPGTGFAKGADGLAFDLIGDAFQRVHVIGTGCATDDAITDLFHPLTAFSAGGALAAGFVGVKIVQVVQHPGHAATVVHDDDTAGAGHGTTLGHGVEVHGDVHDPDLATVLEFVLLVGAQHFGGASAWDDAFKFAAGKQSTAEIVDDLTHGDFADLDFVVAGLLHVATDAEDPGSGVVRRAQFGILRATHLDDVLHMAEGLDIIHDGRAHVETECSGEIRRLDARIRALAFQRFDQTGLFAANVGAGAAVHVDLAIKAGTKDVLAQETFGPGLGDGFLDDLRRERELLTNVNVGQLGVHREAGDGHALNELMRVLMQDVAILERAGLRFVGVADEIDGLGIRRRDKTPLHTRRESCTPATAKTAGFDLIGDGTLLHLHRDLELLIAAVAQVAFDGGVITDPVDVFEDQALLARMGLFAGEVLDCHARSIQLRKGAASGFVKKFTSPGSTRLRSFITPVAYAPRPSPDSCLRCNSRVARSSCAGSR